VQKKIVIDTNVFIDIFNAGKHGRLRDPFRRVAFLTHPVLHELWMGARGRREIRHLTAFQTEFIKLKRLLIPTMSTFIAIGQASRRLRSSGKLDPTLPAHYNDISIAVLARQAGATLITRNTRDFKVIRTVLDFEFESP